MSQLLALFGGTSSINNQVGGGFGLSGADISLVEQALGLGTEQIHNRYAQLGLGVPSGDPATAAASGQSLTSSGPSTMETQDTSGLTQLAQAGLGQLQQANMNNAAIPGSPANAAQNIQQSASSLGQLAQSMGFNNNLFNNTNTNTTTSNVTT
jgi:hypothetical protein